ncbi:MAG: response regulator [Halobacteriovoraceae bacterium]|jgi:DNA-binding NtrC family response regulator|nr:response regulator [Halobacteriovoraceae bacterium]
MKKILVVDDDVDILNLMFHYLKGDGHEVVIVPDGEQAMERLQMAQFDLVITDILMPGINGIDLTCKIIQAFPDMKVLVVSEGGNSDAKEIVAAIVLNKAVSFGALRALMKPFTKDELLEVVKKVLEGKLDEAEEIKPIRKKA